MDPKKSLKYIFPAKYVIPKSLKFSHWPSKLRRGHFKRKPDRLPTNMFQGISYEPGSKLVVLGMVIPPLIWNHYNGYINPYYWVDDHPLLYGNNGSLDPSTYQSPHPLVLQKINQRDPRIKLNLTPEISRWWFLNKNWLMVEPPISKICNRQNGFIFPKFRGENSENM